MVADPPAKYGSALSALGDSAHGSLNPVDQGMPTRQIAAAQPATDGNEHATTPHPLTLADLRRGFTILQPWKCSWLHSGFRDCTENHDVGIPRLIRKIGARAVQRTRMMNRARAYRKRVSPGSGLVK